MKINFEEIKEKFGPKAQEYAKDKTKAKKLVDEAVEKATREKGKKGPIEDIWDKLQLVFGIIKDWATGEYKDVPTGSIILIIIAILYFTNPLDLIPDVIAGAGYIDDVAVLGFVIRQVNSDLEKYKAWKESQS